MDLNLTETETLASISAKIAYLEDARRQLFGVFDSDIVEEELEYEGYKIRLMRQDTEVPIKGYFFSYVISAGEDVVHQNYSYGYSVEEKVSELKRIVDFMNLP
jgi:hypothetical protein